ncbi:MAG: ribosome maturation factor RimP [Clostridia bacterium]|nr:ribosome maturation factor RimP [Clostridia bacterium]
MARKQSSAERAAKICEKVAQELNYELCDVAFDKEPSGLYMRIYIDQEGGITLDDCEKFHRAAQPKLDDIDYDFMEVCSPGIDRPVKTKRDIEKSIGLVVDVKLYKNQDGSKNFQGILKSMDENTVVILQGETEKAFARKDVAQVRLVPDLSGLEEDSNAEIQEIIDEE